MKLTMIINMDNSAFAPNDKSAVGDHERAKELEFLSALLCSRIDEGKKSGALRDSNGNRVGSWEITA